MDDTDEVHALSTSVESLDVGTAFMSSTMSSCNEGGAFTSGDRFQVAADGALATLPGGFGLPVDLYKKVYPHQHDGVAWMWNLHDQNPFPSHCKSESNTFGNQQQVCGGILADDMGMGKTLQVVAFIAGLFHSELTEKAMIIAPVSLLPVWQQEFARWAPEVRVKTFHGTGKDSERAVYSVCKRGGVLLTSYGMCTNRPGQLGIDLSEDGSTPTIAWDIVVLDEGHKIKNPSTHIYKAVQALNAKNRLVLSGTPIQNNMDELWALLNFAAQGKLLGTIRHFNNHIALKIVAARDRHASAADLQDGKFASELLAKMIAPYVLRREKTSLLTAGVVSSDRQLSKKTEVVLWVSMSAPQIKLYHRFLESDEVRLVLNKSLSPLAALTVLKKISNHPLLLDSSLAAAALADGDAEEAGHVFDRPLPSHEELLSDSAKLGCFSDLMRCLIREGHRTLVFSQSRKLLDIIEKVLDKIPATSLGDTAQYVRIDGSIVKPEDRQRIVARFNEDASINACLLTTGVGSLGLTLTGADRVIIFDPSWNPAVEQQAVDRAYRVGQKKDVITYRLISCGTVEEKMYKVQVFKGGVNSSVISADICNTDSVAKQPTRLLTKSDLKDMFTLGDVRRSHTKDTIASFATLASTYDDKTAVHLRCLELGMNSECFVGYSQHDQLFRLALSDQPALTACESIKKHDAMNEVLRSFAAPGVRSASGLTADPPQSTSRAFPDEATEPMEGSSNRSTCCSPEGVTLVEQGIDCAPVRHAASPQRDSPISVPGGNLCCTRHMAKACAAGICQSSLRRCECALTPGSSELLEFAREVLRAAELQTLQASLTEKLETTLDALAVCDCDLDLHVHAMKIGSALGWLSE